MVGDNITIIVAYITEVKSTSHPFEVG